MRAVALLFLTPVVACAPLGTLRSPTPVPVQQAAVLPPSTIRRPPPGPHPVGFRSVEVHDRSRGFGAPFDEDGQPAVVRDERPIAISLWYPATAEGGLAMRLVDYLGYETEPGVFAGPPDVRAARVRALLETPPPAPHVAREFEAAVHARSDAPAAVGRFPLVVYAPGLGAPPTDNFYLHEWLASHGYVVVGVESWGPTGPMRSDAIGLETQVRDMEFALGWARAQENVDATKVAFVGFSWGGMANVMAAMRNPAVQAIVSLDGSIHYYAERMQDFPAFHPDRLTVPSLFLSAKQLAQRRASGAPDFVGRLHYADATSVVFPQLGHLNFSALAPLLSDASPMFVTDTLVMGRVLETIAQYTTAFLDAVVKNDDRARAFLARSPEENGVPAGEALIERRVAQRPLPTRAAFIAEVRRQGQTLASAPDVLATIRRANPAWTLHEREVDTWGYALQQQKRHAEALGVFEVNARLHPESPDAHFNLGKAREASGRLAEAVASYRRAAELAEAAGDARALTSRANVQRLEAQLRERP